MKINHLTPEKSQSSTFKAYFSKNSQGYVKKLVENTTFHGFDAKEDALKLIDKFKKNLPNHELEILDITPVDKLKKTFSTVATGKPVTNVKEFTRYDKLYSYFEHHHYEEVGPEHVKANFLADSELSKKIKYTFFNHTTYKKFEVLLDEKNNNLRALYNLFNENTLYYFNKSTDAEKTAAQKRNEFINKLTDSLTTKPD